MSGAPHSPYASFAHAGLKTVALLLLTAWFFLPVLYFWAAFELWTIEPNLPPSTDHATAAHVAIAFVAVAAFALPIIVRLVGSESGLTRKVARVQLGVASAIAAIVVTAFLFQTFVSVARFP